MSNKLEWVQIPTFYCFGGIAGFGLTENNYRSYNGINLTNYRYLYNFEKKLWLWKTGFNGAIITPFLFPYLRISDEENNTISYLAVQPYNHRGYFVFETVTTGIEQSHNQYLPDINNRNPAFICYTTNRDNYYATSIMTYRANACVGMTITSDAFPKWYNDSLFRRVANYKYWNDRAKFYMEHTDIELWGEWVMPFFYKDYYISKTSNYVGEYIGSGFWEGKKITIGNLEESNYYRPQDRGVSRISVIENGKNNW